MATVPACAAPRLDSILAPPSDMAEVRPDFFAALKPNPGRLSVLLLKCCTCGHHYSGLVAIDRCTAAAKRSDVSG